MTGEDGKRGGGAGDVTSGGNVNANVDNANVNANISVSQQNGGPEKAPVVGGSNVETLPRAGKQVSFGSSLLISTSRMMRRSEVTEPLPALQTGPIWRSDVSSVS